MEQALANTNQRGGNHESWEAYRCREETRERLSSLIRQKNLHTGGRDDDCYWVLLADSSTDTFVILQGIHASCLRAACNDEFQLVAVGSAVSKDGCCLQQVFWPGAKDLACVVDKIMRKKNRDLAVDAEIFHKSAIHGLLLYDLVGCEAQFSTPMMAVNCLSMWPSAPLTHPSLPSLELDMEMLSRVLKPPSVLATAAAASPALLTQGANDDNAPLVRMALVSVGVDNNNNPCEAFSYELAAELAMYSPFGHEPSSGGDDGMNMIMTTTTGDDGGGGHRRRRSLFQELAPAPPHAHGLVTAATEFLVRHWCRDYDLLEAQRRLRRLDYDLEAAGAQAHRVAHLLVATAAATDGTRRGGGAAAAAPVQEASEAANNLLEGVLVQAFAAFLPACVTAYPLLKDAPDYVKFTVFGGLASITVGLFAGILSRSVVRRGLAIRLVSFSAIAVLTFSVASQLSSRAYVALTALVGLALNLMVMLLRF